MAPGLLPLLLLLASPLLGSTLALRLSAFNIQTFGDSKLSNQTIASLIVRIVSAYDITLVQEVRDADLSAVQKLMDQLNEASPSPFDYVVSKPLGRSSYKEQYLFIYREDKVLLLDSYYYDDGCEPCGNDTFSREPFIVKFLAPETSKDGDSLCLAVSLPWEPRWPGCVRASRRGRRRPLLHPWPVQEPRVQEPRAQEGTEVKELILVPLHTPPREAVAEIDALYDVYLDVQEKWGSEEMIFLGDFNAGCSFVRPADWAHIRLRTSHAFQWLIPDSADTTVTRTVCAYDRIVVAGPQLRDGGVLRETAQVEDFQQAFQLSYKDALAVSDHFPVEVTLK